MSDEKAILLQISNTLSIIIGAGSWIGVGTLIFCMVKYFPSQTFCNMQHQHNKSEHDGIKGWIEDNEKRADRRHNEYREDMRELKELIRNGGRDKKNA